VPAPSSLDERADGLGRAGQFPNLAALNAARANLVAILRTGLPSGILEEAMQRGTRTRGRPALTRREWRAVGEMGAVVVSRVWGVAGIEERCSMPGAR
jgi:hypothetical protein